MIYRVTFFERRDGYVPAGLTGVVDVGVEGVTIDAEARSNVDFSLWDDPRVFSFLRIDGLRWSDECSCWIDSSDCRVIEERSSAWIRLQNSLVCAQGARERAKKNEVERQKPYPGLSLSTWDGPSMSYHDLCACYAGED